MRSVLVVIAFILYIIIFMPVLIVLWLLRNRYHAQVSTVTFHMIKTFFRVELFLSGVKVEKAGLENIPDEPVLFVANHRSYFDILSTLVCMRSRTGYVAKAEMGSFPFMAQWMVVLDCVFLKRDNIKEGLKAILSTIDKIKSGTNMFIFPEGTRNSGPDKDVPAEFREGSLKAAQKAGCKIVPVAIKNTESIYEAQRPIVKSARVRITFLKPYYITDVPAEYKKTPARYTRMLIEEELRKPL